MDYTEFSRHLASAEALEASRSFEQAQAGYRNLLANELDEDQRASALVGTAACFLWMSEPSKAVRALTDLQIEELDQTVQAVVCNVRAQAFHELGEYERAIIEATFAETLARTVGKSDADVLGESLARQGFAEAELGRLSAAAEHLSEAWELPINKSIAQPVESYFTRFDLETYI
jgi:tetratricopeptide (TPR) repeat protein